MHANQADIKFVLHFRRELGLEQFIVEVMGVGAIDKIGWRAGKEDREQHIGGYLN